MSVISDVIAEDRVAALKERNKVKRSILSLVLGEIDTVERRTGKNVDDGKVVSIINGLIDSCKETGDTEEIKILERYIPKQLTREQIKKFMTEMYVDPTLDKPKKSDVFAYFKFTHAGTYDGAVVGQVYNEVYGA